MGKTLQSARHKALIDLLIAKRKASGLTQTELATCLGEYQSFVARVESGQRRIDVVELIDLGAALKFDPAEVIQMLKKGVKPSK